MCWPHVAQRCAFLLLLVLLTTTCSDNSAPSKPTPTGALLLSNLVVGLTPNGSDEVTLSSSEPGGDPGECASANSDPSVASAVLIDSKVQIAALSEGRTTVTVTNDWGMSCVLTVHVYSPHVLDAGDLLITCTTEFEFLYSWGTIGFWKPVPPPGFHALGTYSASDYVSPNGNVAVVVVREKPGSEAIKLTSSFDSYYSQIHTPIPPPGYKALGNVFTRPDQTPEPLACVREDLTTPAGIENFYIEWDSPMGTRSLWNIVQKQGEGVHCEAYLPARTCVFWFGEGSPPLDHPVLHLLKIDLPMIAEDITQDYFPTLTDYDAPPSETVPRRAWMMLVPCTMVRDLVPGHGIPWQVANSPVYVLEREAHFERKQHVHNSTNADQRCEWHKAWGISTTETERVWSETAIEVSVSAGLSFKAVEGSISATVTERFGYETQTSVEEFKSGEEVLITTVPPHASLALWQQVDQYRLYRHNGAAIEPVAEWEVELNSYATDQYPDD